MVEAGLVFALTLLATGLIVVAAYLVVLTVAALIGHRPAGPVGSARHRFAILIPAHQEEALIGRLLESLTQLDYPKNRIAVYVVADNCTDQTASIARAYGGRVYERFDTTLQGKGFALRWLLERIREQGSEYDAFVVLDADSTVEANFARSIDARLEAGSQVVQAYYTVLNVGVSPVATLRYAALAALHYLRPLGRLTLGLSCGLKGNGMCFAASVLNRFDWNWYTLAEDVEFHLALVRAGVRVDFAPETTVFADMPVTLSQAVSQNERWERGRWDLVRTQVPGVVAGAVRQRSALQLDAAIEQFIPPLSVPLALGMLCLAISVPLGAGLAATLAAFSLVGQMAYLIAGLILVQAPRSVYFALAYAPVYMAWKVWLYARALARTRGSSWIRTARVVGAIAGGRR